MFRAAIFDLDGTLADTLETIGSVVNFALGSMGLPEHELAAYKSMVGEGIAVLVRKALPPRHPELFDELLKRARARYATHYLDRARLYDGMRETLEELRRRDAKLAVLSNKPHDLTVKTIDGLGIAPLFQKVLGQSDRFPAKPDPAIASHLQRELGVAADEVLYVGDSAIDMDTARNAGFAALGVTWGFRGRDELLAHGARWLVDAPREILPVYAGVSGERLTSRS